MRAAVERARNLVFGQKGDMSPSVAAPGDAWVTWFDRVHVVALAVGVLLAAVEVAVGEPPLPQRLSGVAVAAVLAAWIWYCLFHLRPGFYETSRWPFLFVAVALPLYIALGLIGTSYQFLLFLAYWQIFSVLPLRWSIPVATLFTFANAWAHEGFDWQMPLDAPEEWSLFLGAIFLSAVMAAFITAIINQSRERQALVDELNATRSNLAESERAAGVIEERHRLAGEVHDTIAQDFTSVVMHLEAAEANLPADAPAATYIAMAKQSARSGLHEARRIVHALRPDILEGASLDRALETQAAQWSRETGIVARFTVTGDPLPLVRETEVVLLRALREALANARKHAEPTQVDVTLSYLDDEVILDVRDNGAGFDASTATAGIGLLTMRERVAGVGGRVEIESTPGESATVVVVVPLARIAEEVEA